MVSEPVKGIIAMATACTIWGLSALFYKLIAHVPPLEVLCHRTIWGLAVLLVILWFQGRLPELRATLGNRKTIVIITIASIMLAINWFTFILSVQIGKLVESALGYYIFPLVAVFFGRMFLNEQLTPARQIAVVLAAIAVSLLTYGLGVPPFIALLLAVTFGLYGLLKKPLPIGPMMSVAAEMLVLAPIALFWLYAVHALGWQGPAGRDGGYFAFNMDGFLLMLAGPLTAIPLVMMASAMRRLTLSTVGLVQFVNPTLQFAVGVLIFGEVISPWHILAFVMIWTGLSIYSWDGWKRERAMVKPSPQ